MINYIEMKRNALSLIDQQDEKENVMTTLVVQGLEILENVNFLNKNNRSKNIMPLLREVYEVSVILMGLALSEISVNEFITYEAKENKRRSFLSEVSIKINSNNLINFGKTKSDVLRTYLTELHSLLSVHTHINIDSVLRYSITIIDSEELKDLINLDNLNTIYMVECLFSAVYNEIYKTDIHVEKIDSERFGDILLSMRDKKIPKSSLYTKLSKIEAIKLLHINRLKDMKEAFTKENLDDIREKLEEIK